MYNVSDGFKNAVFSGKTTRAKLVIDDIEITESNGLKDLTFEDSRYTPNLGIFGSVSSRRVTGNIYDINNSISLEGKEFKLYIGVEVNGVMEYINYGNFIVQKAPKDTVTNIIEFEAFDYMIKLNEPYKTELLFPVTIKDIFNEILSKFNLTSKTSIFRNQDHIVEANLFINNETYRDVIKAIAQIAFSWARIDEDNNLNLDFDIINDPNVILDIDEYINANTNESEYGPINTIILRNSQIEGENVTVRDEESIIAIGSKELVISDNPFAYTQDKRLELIQAAKNIFGFRYNAIDYEGLGTIYLNCKDKLRIKTLNGDNLDTYVFNHSIKYQGIASDTIKTEAMTETQTKYQNTSNILNRVGRTEVIVDKVNKEITSVVQEIGDRSDKETSVTQDLDRIESQVSSIYDALSEVVGISKVELPNAIEGSLVSLKIKGNGKVTGGLWLNNETILGDNTILADFGDRFTFSPNYITEELIISQSTIVSNGTGTIKVTSIVDNEQVVKYFDLGVKEPLRANELFHDEYILEDGIAKIIRRVFADGTSRPFEKVEEIGPINIKLSTGDNTVELLNYTTEIRCEYALKTEFSEIFATRVEMNTSIEQTAEEINLEVSKKIDEDVAISLIKQSAEEVEISVSNQFDGKEIASRLNISEDEIILDARTISLAGDTVVINNQGITLADGSRIVNANGLYTNLQFVSKGMNVWGVGNYSSLGVEELNYYPNPSIFKPVDIVIDVFIPNNFVIISANINLNHTPVELGIYDQFSGQTNYVNGSAKNVKAYTTKSNYIVRGNWLSSYTVEISNIQEISGAFGTDGISFSSASLGQVESVSSADIASSLSVGAQKIVLRGNYSVSSSTQAASNTGLAFATLDILGYLKEI